MNQNRPTHNVIRGLLLFVIGGLLLVSPASLALNAPLTEAYFNGAPDLVVTGIDFGNIDCTNDNISGSVSVTVKNQGTAAANNFQVALATDVCLSPPGNQTVTELGYGTSTTVTFNITGSWVGCSNCSCQFTATVDATYAVNESNETNNQLAETYTSDLPDLRVNSVTPSATCNSDGNLQGTVTVNVSNTGCGTANGAVVRLTSDCGIGFADQTINLAAGSSTDVTFTYTPVCTACTCIFTATADPGNTVCECDGTNNTPTSAPFTMTVPDIEVQADTLAVSCVDDGQATISGTVTLVNNGCGVNLAADIPMRFTLLDNTGCSGNQLSQWTQTFTGVNIASAGGTQIFTITPQTINTDLCTNSFNCQVSIRVEADYSGSICECDGTDNTYCADNKAVDIPDLEVTNDTLAVACSGDGEVTVSGNVTLANNGCGGNLTADIPMRFTIFDNTGCSGNQVAQWTETLSSINIAAGGGTQVFTITPYNMTADLCDDSTNCQVSIRVEADYNDSICECDGDNNSLCTDESLTTPDLAVNSVTPASDPNGNGTVTVNVGNDGCADANGTVVRLTSDCGLTFSDQTIDLAASASANLAFNFFTADCGDCICTFTAAIDPDDAFCECSGTNNSQEITSGTMTIVKDAVPDNVQDFSFTGDLGDFDLDDDPGDATLPNSVTFMRPSGTYSITETGPLGWEITDIVCDDGSPTHIPSGTAYIDLTAGEAVTCTFTNELLFDYGDAPEPMYPTLLASTGARHGLGSDVYLGACVDTEADGQPTAGADGDDTAMGSTVFGTCVDDDDEDGVTFFTSVLRVGETAYVDVVANAACDLSAWIDFNADGDWADADEEIFSGQALAAGTNSLSFAVPGTAVVGTTYARFRCTTDGAVTFTGPASDGEVEDYQVMIQIATLCPADLDSNWWVNTADLSVLVSQWGECPGCIADLNGNGWVNTTDLSILVSQWGECP